MKKKILLSFLLVGVLTILCSCGSQAINSGVDSANTESESVTDDFEMAEINTTIANETCELTITKSTITHAVFNEETGLNLEEDDDNGYIVFFGTIKNFATTEISFASGLQARILVDEKYSYPVEMVPYNDLDAIVPLKEITFAVYATVPEEVISSCETYDFQFGFNDNFDVTLADLDEAKYKYDIAGDIDEYGSADSIVNFRTFSEFIQTAASENFPDYNVEVEDEYSWVNIDNGNGGQDIKIGDGKFSVFPYLRVSYTMFDCVDEETGLSPYGRIIFQVFDYTNSDLYNGIYYTGADELTLASDNGTLTLDGYEKFELNSHQTSLDEVYNIVSGDNLKVEVHVPSSNSDDLYLSQECSEEFKNTIIALLDFYRQLPNAYMGRNS